MVRSVLDMEEWPQATAASCSPSNIHTAEDRGALGPASLGSEVTAAVRKVCKGSIAWARV
jgi:hypothetical protein